MFYKLKILDHLISTKNGWVKGGEKIWVMGKCNFKDGWEQKTTCLLLIFVLQATITPVILLYAKPEEKTGPYKRTQTAALLQAKFYLPRQAGVIQQLIYCGAAVDERLLFSLV